MLGNVITAVVVLAVIALVVAVAGIIYVLARPKPPEPTVVDQINAALSHPPEPGTRPVEIVRDALIPRPLSAREQAELAAELRARKAGAGNPSTPTAAASPTATPGATAPPAPSTDPVTAAIADAARRAANPPK